MAYVNNHSKEEQKALAKQKVEKSLAKINTDVVSVFDSREFPKYLAFAANFHYFDVNNTLLVYKQRPTATFLASYKGWEKYSVENFGDPNRLVFTSSQKGKGVGILAPYILKTKLASEAGQKNKVISYIDYHVVFVFDKEQTNGIPAPAMSWDLSKSPQDCIALFSSFFEKAPFSIKFLKKPNNTHKYTYNPPGATGSRGVLILNQEDSNNYYILCSYILNTYVPQSLEKLKKEYSEGDYEKICECVTFMLASYFGLPTEEFYFFFVKVWGASIPSKMMDILNVVQSSAHKLIGSLEAGMVFYKNMNDTNDFYDNNSVFSYNSMGDF